MARFPDVSKLGEVSVDDRRFVVLLVDESWEPNNGHDSAHAQGRCECPCSNPLDVLLDEAPSGFDGLRPPVAYCGSHHAHEPHTYLDPDSWSCPGLAAAEPEPHQCDELCVANIHGLRTQYPVEPGSLKIL